MKKKIFAALTASVMAVTAFTAASVLPVSAEVQQTPEAAALLKQVQYGSYEQYTPIPADAGILTPDGMAAVTRIKGWKYAGIAFTCADADALTAAAPAAHPIHRSEGQYLDYSPSFFEIDDGEYSDVFLMQSLTGYADAFTNRWGDYPGMNTGTDGDILADFSGADGTVFLIASHLDNAEELVTWLCQQDVQILGVGYGTWEDTGWYDNIPPVLYAAPEDGYTLSEEDFSGYATRAIPVENNPFGYWEIDLPVELSYEEAQAICDELEQSPKISYVAHQPNAFMSEPNQDNLRVELVAPAAAVTEPSLSEIIQAGLPDEVIPAETPTEDCISYHCEYQYEGVAVTCEDIEALKKDGLNGIPVEWSDGIWSTYWNPAGAEFLLQPIEGLSKEFGDFLKYEGGIPDGAEDMAFTLPEEYTDLDEPVYVLYAPKTDTGRLDAALAADSSVTVIGALFCGILNPMEYVGADFAVTLGESAIITDQVFLMYGFELKETGKANHYALSELEPDPRSFENALALYNLFSEFEGVQKVEWYGTVIDIMPYRAATTTAKIVPFTPKALTGDVDGDGNADSFAFRDPTEQAFCERVAGWENVTLQDCVLLRTKSGNAQVLTPEHPYTIQYFRTGPYRITFSGDNVPKEEEVLEKWAEMLRDTSYRDQELHCTFKPAEYGYDVMANMGILLEECLKSFPQTESIDAQYAYRTDDHANHYDGGYAYDYSYCFQCDRTPVPEDFPSLDVASIRKDEPTGAWKLYLNNDQYSDYFAGFRTMLDSEIVKNLGFDYIITQLFDERDDAQMNLPERTVVYRRGDIDGDGMITADDAVLALKGANEITAETEADARTLTPAQEAAGDVDGDGELTAFDAFCILKYFNLREVAEVEDLTWADVLPGA